MSLKNQINKKKLACKDEDLLYDKIEKREKYLIKLFSGKYICKKKQ